jgi:hypothetical protein
VVVRYLTGKSIDFGRIKFSVELDEADYGRICLEAGIDPSQPTLFDRYLLMSNWAAEIQYRELITQGHLSTAEGVAAIKGVRKERAKLVAKYQPTANGAAAHTV